MILRTPITPAAIYRAESRAVGAQWELASRLAPEMRVRQIELLKRQAVELERAKLANDFALSTKNIRGKMSADDFVDIYPGLSDDSKSDIVAAFLQNKHFSNFGISTAAEFEALIQAPNFRRALSNPTSNAHLTQMKIFVDIAEGTLNNAHLPKDQFIEAMREKHGYDLKSVFAGHYNMKGFMWRMTAMLSLISGGFMVAEKDDPAALKRSVDSFPAYDIRLLMNVYFGLADHQEAESSAPKK